MKMLVIGSCTGDKNIRDCPGLLAQPDFDDPSQFQRREAELSPWALPARELYTGWQHRYMMNGVDRREKVTALAEQAAFRFSNETIDINGTAEREMAMTATPSLFNLLRVEPLLGRTFSAEEGEIGAEQKIILSYGLWQQIFGGNPAPLGREVRLDGRPFTVVGVMPSNFVFIDPEVRMWIPTSFT